LTGSNGLNKTHFIQGAPGRMVVGSLDNSSTMRIFTWADSASTIPPPSTVGISSIPQGANYTSTAPDGSDWLAVSFPGNITGGAFRNVPADLLDRREEYLNANGKRKLPWFIDPIEGRLKIERNALLSAYFNRQVEAERNCDL
jgi:hypothetical protein